MAKKSHGPRNPAPKPAMATGHLLPDEYESFLGVLKERIQTAQLRAAVAVNRELVLLDWQIGRNIL